MRLAARCTKRVLSRGSLRGSAAGGARLRGRSPWRRPGSGSKRAVLPRIMCAPSRSDPRSGGAPPPALRRAYQPALLATLLAPARRQRVAASSHGIDAEVGQRIGAMITWRFGVSADPVPLDVVLAREAIERLPQVRVLDRLASRRFPAVLFPSVNPVFDAFLDVLRIGVHRDGAASVEALKRANDCGKLHAVVGCIRLAAENLALDAPACQESSPPARARITLARAVGVNDDRRAPAPRFIRQARA